MIMGLNALYFLVVVQIAHSIIEQVTSEPIQAPKKNPAAVALGRLGGLKGGKARAEKLSDEQKPDIARKAALSRWNRKK
jgi:hypothetical protein